MDEPERGFLQAAEAFCTWAETFDPERTDAGDVHAALAGVVDRAPPAVLSATEPPQYRIFRPNETWQGIQRRVARLPFNGYGTARLPNDDRTPDTQCALSYDISDFHEMLSSRAPDAPLSKYLSYVSWGYANVRIHGAMDALNAQPWIADPFELRPIKGRILRFVSWRTASHTHASEEPADVRGPGTLCGGKLAFHKHTQQQWSTFPCLRCRRIVDGLPARYGEPPWVELVVSTDEAANPEY